MGSECFGPWKLESHSSPTAGRFLVATQDIAEGELLFRARAYLFALYETHRKQVCAFCARFSTHRLSVSCKGCDCVYYCSGACKEAHQRLHAHFCRVFARLPTRKFDNSTAATMYLLLEVAIRQLEGSAHTDTAHRIDVPFVCAVQEEGEGESDPACPVAGQTPTAAVTQSGTQPCVHTDTLQGHVCQAAGTSPPDHTVCLDEHGSSSGGNGPQQRPAATAHEPSLPVCTDTEHPPSSPPLNTEAVPTEQVPNEHPDVLGLYVPRYSDFEQLCWSEEEMERWGQAVRVVVDTLRMCGHTYTDEAGLRQHAARIENNGFGFFKTTGRKDAMVGVCVTPPASYFNHSCCPNAKSWGGSSLLTEFYATRDIKCGEEVCISYIDTEQPRSGRQKQLQAQYQFTCTCARCEHEAGGQGVGAGRKGRGGAGAKSKGKPLKARGEKRVAAAK